MMEGNSRRSRSQGERSRVRSPVVNRHIQRSPSFPGSTPRGRDSLGGSTAGGASAGASPVLDTRESMIRVDDLFINNTVEVVNNNTNNNNSSNRSDSFDHVLNTMLHPQPCGVSAYCNSPPVPKREARQPVVPLLVIPSVEPNLVPSDNPVDVPQEAIGEDDGTIGGRISFLFLYSRFEKCGAVA